MATQSFLATKKTWTPGRALLYGGLTVGTLDITYAFLFYGIGWGLTPLRILHSVASGLLGQAAFEGGLRTGALGLLLHYFIAFSIATTYFLATRWLPALNRRPWLFGVLYGIGVYFFMNLVVVPLSAAGYKFPHGANLVGGLLIHMFGIGLPSALFARAARRP
jgi:hypothetical protein